MLSTSLRQRSTEMRPHPAQGFRSETMWVRSQLRCSSYTLWTGREQCWARNPELEFVSEKAGQSAIGDSTPRGVCGVGV